MRSQIDSLNHTAREFYERSRMKLVLSLILASFGMMFLAMVAGSGATAAAVYKISKLSYDGVSIFTGDSLSAIQALRSGIIINLLILLWLLLW